MDAKTGVPARLAARWFTAADHTIEDRGLRVPGFEPPDWSIAERSLIEALEPVVARHEQRIVYDQGAETVTYRAMWRLAGRLAHALEQAALPSGPVGLLLPASAGYLAGVLACFAVGRPCVLLDPTVPHERNVLVMRTTGAVALLTASAGAAPTGYPTITLDALPDAPPAPLTNRLGQDAAAYIICTSGSTGVPKAIVHSQRTMNHWLLSVIHALQATQDDRVLCISSPSSAAGVTPLLTYPLVGATVQTPDLAQGGFRHLLALLRQKRVTTLFASASLLRNIAALPGTPAAMASLRIIYAFGEPLLRTDAAALHRVLPAQACIFTVYGSTEASGNTAWFARATDAYDALRTPAGTLMPHVEAMIVDDAGAPCGPEEVGELVIRGRYTSCGEWHDGRLVLGRLTEDPDDPHLRICHTGDLARRSADGVFVVVGRRDRMVNVNGQRVEPAEIETALRRSPDVAQAAVVARQDGEAVILLGFVQPHPGAAPDLAEQLRAALVPLLPPYMQPSRIVVLDALPRLPSGKVDEAALLRGVTEG